ncbi:MAG: hypothetical protein ACYTF1_22620, partial [Planctomycetota bacterium]
RSKAVIRLLCLVLVAGAVWNLYRIGRLYYDHTRHGSEPMNVYGRTDLFVEGLPHLAAINKLGPAAKVMMVGEARSFYVKTPCEYAVVFSHHRLDEAAWRLPHAKAVVHWLVQEGFTHLYVDWSEMHRLRQTYGFHQELTPDLFAIMKSSGLKELDSFETGPQGLIYSTLYGLSPDE